MLDYKFLLPECLLWPPVFAHLYKRGSSGEGAALKLACSRWAKGGVLPSLSSHLGQLFSCIWLPTFQDTFLTESSLTLLCIHFQRWEGPLRPVLNQEARSQKARHLHESWTSQPSPKAGHSQPFQLYGQTSVRGKGGRSLLGKPEPATDYPGYLGVSQYLWAQAGPQVSDLVTRSCSNELKGHSSCSHWGGVIVGVGVDSSIPCHAEAVICFGCVCYHGS